MLILVTTRVTNEITTAANIADQKLFTSSLSLHRATNIKIDAFTTTRKSPSVRITAGKVSNLIKDPKVAFKRPKRSATHK